MIAYSRYLIVSQKSLNSQTACLSS
jgi:hypothetical protein